LISKKFFELLTELVTTSLKLCTCPAPEEPVESELWIVSDKRFDVVVRIFGIHAEFRQFTDKESIFLFCIILAIASSVHVRYSKLDFRKFVACYFLSKRLLHTDLLFDPLLSFADNCDQPLMILDFFVAVPKYLKLDYILFLDFSNSFGYNF
jgi:hypothetical protein